MAQSEAEMLSVDGDGPVDPSLEELLETETLKWIFVGGKGGVGKTTTSCSIAIQLAQKRQTVLILSTDPAHNLSDAFTQKFRNTPTLVNGFKNLYAMEIDASLHSVEEMGFKLAQNEGWKKILPELMSAFPGIDEAISFAELMQSVQTMTYSVIVFDTAPTGHTLRLLSFPAILDEALKKLYNFKDKMGGAIQMFNMVTRQAIDEEEIHQKLDSLKAVTTSVRETFRDPAMTTFVCVSIPEFLSVYETERLLQQLANEGIDCSNIVINQVLFPIQESAAEDKTHPAEGPPADEATGSLKEENERLRATVRRLQRRVDALEESHTQRRRMQSKYLRQVQELYSADFHVVCMPVQPQEVRGLPLLKNFGKLLLEKRDLPILEE